MYSPEVAAEICKQLIEGRSLRAICAADEMPDKATVLRWLQNDAIPDFRDHYARARELQAESLLDEILEIADDNTEDVDRVHGALPVVVSRARLKIDARKWAMSKLAPKKYGDSKALDVTSGGERITGFAIVDYTDDDSTV